MWGGWAPKILIQNFLKPMCAALADLAERGEIHGSIRPDNVFNQDSKGQLFALGPCVLGPVGYDQPAPFEPIERALATADGKGAGGSIDDMFALGMTLYCFATGKYPGEGQQPDALMGRRLAYGSTSAMIDTSQIPSELFDPVMALIDDDVKTRWSLAAITDWTSGRRPQIPQKRPAARRGSPIQIGPIQCLEPRELAFAIGRYPDQAATAMDHGEIANWLKANDVQRAIALNIDESGPTQIGVSQAVLLAREAVRLDPVGPIRYRDLSFFPNGAGAVIYAALLDGGKRQQFEEMFSARLVHLWAKAANPLGLIDEAAKELLELEDRVSNGLEKLESALYKLNADAPCLSPEVQGRWVDTLGDLLDVFEAGLGRGNFEPDAHIVAFLGARGGITAADLGALKTFDGKDPRRAAAILKLGVRIVVEAKGKQLPNLTKICHSAARAMIERLRNPKRPRGYPRQGRCGGGFLRHPDACRYRDGPRHLRRRQCRVHARQAGIRREPAHPQHAGCHRRDYGPHGKRERPGDLAHDPVRACRRHRPVPALHADRKDRPMSFRTLLFIFAILAAALLIAAVVVLKPSMLIYVFGIFAPCAVVALLEGGGKRFISLGGGAMTLAAAAR